MMCAAFRPQRLLMLCLLCFPVQWFALAFQTRCSLPRSAPTLTRQALVSPAFSYLGGLSNRGVPNNSNNDNDSSKEFTYGGGSAVTGDQQQTETVRSLEKEVELASASLQEFEQDRLQLQQELLGLSRELELVATEPIVETSTLTSTQPEVQQEEDALVVWETKDRMWDEAGTYTVQGGCLKTWSSTSPKVEFVQVCLKTEGRPMDAKLEVWQGPDNTPNRYDIYVEDGALTPFHAVIATPRVGSSVAVRNTGNLEFPLDACVQDLVGDVTTTTTTTPGSGATRLAPILSQRQTIQGGALKSYPFDLDVASVQISLSTNGRPMNVRIELMQGPNNDKQEIDIYSENGKERPFLANIQTPGSGNVIRIINKSPMEFPILASVQPYATEA